MQHIWEVMHRLVDGPEMTAEEKAQAHGLIEVHLAQHLGIAAEIGQHRDKIAELDDKVSKTQQA